MAQQKKGSCLEGPLPFALYPPHSSAHSVVVRYALSFLRLLRPILLATRKYMQTSLASAIALHARANERELPRAALPSLAGLAFNARTAQLWNIGKREGRLGGGSFNKETDVGGQDSFKIDNKRQPILYGCNAEKGSLSSLLPLPPSQITRLISRGPGWEK